MTLLQVLPKDMLFALLSNAEPIIRRKLFMTCKSFTQFKKIFHDYSLEDKLAYYEPMICKWKFIGPYSSREMINHFSQQLNCNIELQWHNVQGNLYHTFCCGFYDVTTGLEVKFSSTFAPLEEDKKKFRDYVLEILDVFISHCMQKDQSLCGSKISIYLGRALHFLHFSENVYHWDNSMDYSKEKIIDKCDSTSHHRE